MAFSGDIPLKDKEKEGRARALMREIACVVCEGEAIAESKVPLASAMRSKVRELTAQDKSDTEILSWFQTHYGDEVLMRPSLSTKTLPLWLLPVLSLLIGVVAILHYHRTHKRKKK